MNEQEEGEIVEPEPGSVVVEQRGQRHFKPQRGYEMKSSNYKTKVCEHFKKGVYLFCKQTKQKGSCKNGAKCSFIHPQDITLPICKFFLGGHCNKQRCDYSHDISNYQCKYHFGNGKCTKATCQFSHQPFKSETARTQWIKENFQHLNEVQKNRGMTALGEVFVAYLRTQNQEVRKLPVTFLTGVAGRMIQPPRLKEESEAESMPSYKSKCTPESSLRSIDQISPISDIELEPKRVVRPHRETIITKQVIKRNEIVVQQVEDLNEEWPLSELQMRGKPHLLVFVAAKLGTMEF